jgi:hypothetical protein
LGHWTSTASYGGRAGISRFRHSPTLQQQFDTGINCIKVGSWNLGQSSQFGHSTDNGIYFGGATGFNIFAPLPLYLPLVS